MITQEEKDWRLLRAIGFNVLMLLMFFATLGIFQVRDAIRDLKPVVQVTP